MKATEEATEEAMSSQGTFDLHSINSCTSPFVRSDIVMRVSTITGGNHHRDRQSTTQSHPTSFSVPVHRAPQRATTTVGRLTQGRT